MTSPRWRQAQDFAVAASTDTQGPKAEADESTDRPQPVDLDQAHEARRRLPSDTSNASGPQPNLVEDHSLNVEAPEKPARGRRLVAATALIALAAGGLFLTKRPSMEPSIAPQGLGLTIESAARANPNNHVPSFMNPALTQSGVAGERSSTSPPADHDRASAPAEAISATITADGQTLVAPQAQAEHLTTRQNALPGGAPSSAVTLAPSLRLGPVSTRIAQLSCRDVQPVLFSVAVFNEAVNFDRTIGSFADWTGRQNGMVLFDTKSRPDAVRLADTAKANGLVVLTFSGPDTMVSSIEDESAMSWFVFSAHDAGPIAGKTCVVRLFVR